MKEWNRQLIAKGRQEGEAGLLLRLLARKFGRLDEPAIARVQAARAVQRRTWADRMLTAATLAEVFGESPSP